MGKVQRLVVNDLVRENRCLPAVLERGVPAGAEASFLGRSRTVFRDPQPERAAERSLATNLLADYAADSRRSGRSAHGRRREAVRRDLSEVQGTRRARRCRCLTGEIDKKLPADLPSSDERREKLAKRQANAAVALLRMNQPEKVWPLLEAQLPIRGCGAT